MNAQRCRTLLAVYRPDGSDAEDPGLRAALEETRANPDLAAWFERECALDSAITGRVCSIRVPGAVRRRVLEAVPGSVRSRFGIRVFVAGLVGIAAVAGIVAGLNHVVSPSITVRPFDTIVDSAIAASQRPISLAYFAPSIEDLRAWLADAGGPVPGTTPAGLAGAGTIGCRTFDWEGVRASVVCFRVTAMPAGPDGRSADAVLHLYTVDQRACAGGSACEEPLVFAADGMSAATWRDESHFYILTAHVPESVLRELLSGRQPGAVLALTKQISRPGVLPTPPSVQSRTNT